MRVKSRSQTVPESTVGCNAMNGKNLFSLSFPDCELNLDAISLGFYHSWFWHNSLLFGLWQMKSFLPRIRYGINSSRNPCLPAGRHENIGFRVKPGMTEKRKELKIRYTRSLTRMLPK
jgi:hypothetical protein